MQSVGVLPVDVKAMGVSMLAAGCHKGLLVPQGWACCTWTRR